MDLKTLQELMGHENLSMTETYFDVVEQHKHRISSQYGEVSSPSRMTVRKYDPRLMSLVVNTHSIEAGDGSYPPIRSVTESDLTALE